ncbi:MAG: hypothetical protein U1F43_01855 [Myxococcota bacterium]
MGFIADQVEKKSRKILYKEAAKLGASPEELPVIDLAEQQAGTLKTLAVSILGGASDATRLKRYKLTLDGQPALFVRPFAGGIMHPGEIHAIIPGTPSEASALVHGRGWIGDPALAKDAALAAALAKFSWRLQTHVMFTLPWAVQIRSLGGGQSHLVMKSGSYAGLFAVTYGLARFVAIAAAARAALARSDAPAQAPALPCFAEVALEALRA